MHEGPAGWSGVLWQAVLQGQAQLWSAACLGAQHAHAERFEGGQEAVACCSRSLRCCRVDCLHAKQSAVQPLSVVHSTCCRSSRQCVLTGTQQDY